MSELIGLENVSLVAGGPTLSLSVSSGQSLAIFGPGGSGKSKFLRVLGGFERPELGTVSLRGHCQVASEVALSKRAKPQALARTTGPNQAAKATELLLATRLWDLRNTSVHELSPSQAAAASLLPALAADPEVLLIDGLMDRLDPWTLGTVREHLTRRRSAGMALVVVTHRPEIAKMFDALVVMRDQRVRFAGSIDDLLRLGPPHSVTVATENQPGARALVDPFQVSVRETSAGWMFEAAEGQALTARLLVEGYGDVRYVILRSATVEEALLSLFN